MKKIALAFINVPDKTGVVELASFLTKRGVEIISAGSTLKLLEKNGIKPQDAAQMPGVQDSHDEKLMSLHPAIYSGVAVNRRESSQLEHLKKLGGRPVDLVVVNPAPPPVPVKADHENPEQHSDPFASLDMCGMSLLRAAARNYHDVVSLISPEQYKPFMDDFEKHNGTISEELRRKLALAVFEIAAGHDIQMYNQLFNFERKTRFLPDTLFLTYHKAMELRYGENPHQKACYYKEPGSVGVSLADSVLLKGQPLNYNQMYDLNLALDVVMEFDKPAAAIIRHGVPIGVALDKDPSKAYMRAREVDPNGAHGAVVAFNTQIEKRSAKELSSTYVEAVVAPKYTDGALEHLKGAKKSANMRIIQVTSRKLVKQSGTLNISSVLGGVMVQENNDLLLPEGANLKVLSKRKLTRKQLADLVLAWKVCKHSFSNSVVLAKELQTIGTGAGNSNRLDSLRMAFDKAGDNAIGCVVAFDTTVPYRAIVDETAKFGVSAIIQPGGSVRDDEIVMACDEHNIALALTGMRHFKH